MGDRRPGVLGFLRQVLLGDDRGKAPSAAELRGLAEARGYSLWTVNEIVAYNLRRARQERQLSQEELAAQLQDLTGKPWSNATLSAAERTRESGRVRRFDAGELAAFATVLRVPINYFFLPPETGNELSIAMLSMDELIESYRAAGPSHTGFAHPPGVLVDAIEPPVLAADYKKFLRNALDRYTGRTWEPARTTRQGNLTLGEIALISREVADLVVSAMKGEVVNHNHVEVAIDDALQEAAATNWWVRAVPRPLEVEPHNDLEAQLLDVQKRDREDHPGWLAVMLKGTVIVPLRRAPDGKKPGDDGFPWWTDLSETGARRVYVFTSDARADHFPSTAAAHSRISMDFLDLLRLWPDESWQLLVNPGTDIGRRLPGDLVGDIFEWTQKVGFTDKSQDVPAVPFGTRSITSEIRPLGSEAE